MDSPAGAIFPFTSGLTHGMHRQPGPFQRLDKEVPTISKPAYWKDVYRFARKLSLAGASIALAAGDENLAQVEARLNEIDDEMDRVVDAIGQIKTRREGSS